MQETSVINPLIRSLEKESPVTSSPSSTSLVDESPVSNTGDTPLIEQQKNKLNEVMAKRILVLQGCRNGNYHLYVLLYIVNAMNNGWLATVGTLTLSTFSGAVADGLAAPATIAAGFNSFLAGYYSELAVFGLHKNQVAIDAAIDALLNEKPAEENKEKKKRELYQLLFPEENSSEAKKEAPSDPSCSCQENKVAWFFDRLLAFVGQGLGCGLQTFGGIVTVLACTSALYTQDLHLLPHQAAIFSFWILSGLLILLSLAALYKFIKHSTILEEKRSKLQDSSDEIVQQLKQLLNKRIRTAKWLKNIFTFLFMGCIGTSIGLYESHFVTPHMVTIMVFAVAIMLSLCTAYINYYLSQGEMQKLLFTPGFMPKILLENSNLLKVSIKSSVEGEKNYQISKTKLNISKLLGMVLTLCNSLAFASLVAMGVSIIGASQALFIISIVFFVSFCISNVYIYKSNRDLFISWFGKRELKEGEKDKTQSTQTLFQRIKKYAFWGLITFGVGMLLMDAVQGSVISLQQYLQISASAAHPIAWVIGILASVGLLVFFIRAYALRAEKTEQKDNASVIPNANRFFKSEGTNGDEQADANPAVAALFSSTY